ncbi:MAG: hypothetical protein GY795_29075 [Desulfobacterales bacterium]|nr:hypothetical protein [Desulfobacterales bacterium]
MEKSDIMHFISVTQSQIDNEDEVEFTVDDRQVRLKLPSIAQEGRCLRLLGGGTNGGNLYLKIKVLQ